MQGGAKKPDGQFSLRSALTREPGGDNNMEVTLSSWNPGNVQCTGVGPPPKTCVIIVVTMNVSAQSLVFGLKSDPRVQEGLPHVLSNGK